MGDSVISAVRSAPASTELLSVAEAQERYQLREALRSRSSVDAFARAWYGSILSLILTGVCFKLSIDSPGRWFLVPVALGSLGGWVFAGWQWFKTRQLMLREGRWLFRLRNLDERAPKAPELF